MVKGSRFFPWPVVRDSWSVICKSDMVHEPWTVVYDSLWVYHNSWLIEQYQYQPKPKLAYDEPPFQGPMNGILTGMQLAQYDNCLVVPCDVPLIKTEVLQVLINLLEQANDSPAIIPRWPNGYREPLTAIYRKSLMLDPLRRHFQQGERKIQNVLDALPAIRYVTIACLQKVDPELYSFININTEEDLHKLSHIDIRGFK